MQTDAQIFSGAFTSPVLSSQSVFRALMDGMARPGRVFSLVHDASAPAPACPSHAALALTLADADTSVWLSPSLAGSAFARWLSFQTGASIVPDRMEAMFAFVSRKDALSDWNGFLLGSDTYPDRSATLVVEVEALSGGIPLIAEGPGIDGAVSLSPIGLPADFLRERVLNRSLYPRGIDLVLVCGSDCLCLPRTARLMLEEV